jgi:hypothetical protein
MKKVVFQKIFTVARSLPAIVVALSLFGNSPYAMAEQANESSRVKYIYRKFAAVQEQVRGAKTAREIVSLFGSSLTTKEKDYFLERLNGRGLNDENLLKNTQMNLGTDGKLMFFQSGKRVATVEIVDLKNRVALINGKPFHYRPYASTITMVNEVLAALESPRSATAVGWALPSKLFYLFAEQSAHAGTVIKAVGKFLIGTTLGKFIVAATILHILAVALVCPLTTETREARDTCSDWWWRDMFFKTWESLTHGSEHTYNSVRDASLYLKGPAEINITEIKCKEPARKAEQKVNDYGVAVKTLDTEGVASSGATFSIPGYQLKGSLRVIPDSLSPSIAFTFIEAGNNEGVADSEVIIPLDKNLRPLDKVTEASGPVGWSGQGNALKNAHFATDILEICKDAERVAKVNARLSQNPRGLTPLELKSAVQ